MQQTNHAAVARPLPVSMITGDFCIEIKCDTSDCEPSSTITTIFACRTGSREYLETIVITNTHATVSAERGSVKTYKHETDGSFPEWVIDALYKRDAERKLRSDYVFQQLQYGSSATYANTGEKVGRYYDSQITK